MVICIPCVCGFIMGSDCGSAPVVWIKKKGYALNSLLIVVVFNDCSCCKLKTWVLAGVVGVCVYLCVDSKF